MYRENDINSINSNIKKIIEESSYLYKLNNEPTLDEIKKVYDIIIKFIILLIYFLEKIILIITI